MLVLIIYLLAFSTAFYIVARNQFNFDELDKDEETNLRYKHFYGALVYTWQLSIGETDVQYFEYGNGQSSFVLHSLFALASFVMLIHFLNMLIAIMGNTFAKRNDKLAETKFASALRFVI